MQKTQLNKTKLLEWVNECLLGTGLRYDKIQQLGTGVAYLSLLGLYYSGSTSSQKINYKPSTPYDNQKNLKYFLTCLHKLHIELPMDIMKVSQMKYQDNFQFLQAFYLYLMNNAVSEKVHIEQEEEKLAPKGKKIQWGKRAKKMSDGDMEDFEKKCDKRDATSIVFHIDEIIHKNEKALSDEVKLQRIRHLIMDKYFNSSQNKGYRSNKLSTEKQQEKSYEKIAQSVELKSNGSKTRMAMRLDRPPSMEESISTFVDKDNSILKRPILSQNMPEYQQKKIDSIPEEMFQRKSERLTENSLLLNERKSNINDINLIAQQEDQNRLSTEHFENLLKKFANSGENTEKQDLDKKQ